MAQSLAQNLLHLVYSTKDRRPILGADIRESMFGMSVTVFDRLKCPVLLIGGTEDHIHILFSLSRNEALAKVVQVVKSSTSKWANEGGGCGGEFAWQSGYGAFSVSQSNVRRVKDYIANQEEHHLKFSFQDELRTMLRKHKIEFDERYIWD